jgi:hypothetical protein
MREAFARLGGRTLITLDGTEYFCSQKITCPHCQTRKRSNGKTESYHSMLAATVVAPGHSKVIPLSPEFIVKQDGAKKQDCERSAVKAFVTSLPVAKANVAEIAACGRARWKIENESFNVLKEPRLRTRTQLRPWRDLSGMTLAGLNLLAFAWHTVLDLIEPPWRKARQAAEKRTSFFAYLASRSSPPRPTSSKPSLPSPSRPTSSLSKKTNKQMTTQATADF